MNLRKAINLAAATATMAVMTFAVWGQAMTRIIGSVKGEDGAPVQGAEVVIQRTDIRNTYNVKTGKDGRFTYATLPLGTYEIKVTLNGATIHEENNVRTDYNKAYEVNIDLQKKAQAQATAAAAANGMQMAKGYVPLPNTTLPPLTVQVSQAPATGAPGGDAAANGMSEAEMAAAKAKYDAEMKAYEAEQGKMKGLQDAFAAGRAALEARNFDAAISMFEKAGEFDPKQEAVWANMAESYRLRAESKRGSERTADYLKSAESWAKAIAVKPEDASFYMDQSLAYARANKMTEAQASLDKGAALNPALANRGYRNLGAAYFDSGNAEAAEGAFRKAIQLDPNQPDAHFQLGLSLMQRVTEENGKLKAPAGTAEAFQKYLELAPSGGNAAEAQAMLEALGATLTNRVTNSKANNTKGKK